MATSGGAGQFASAAHHHDTNQPGVVAEAPRQLPKRLRIGYATGSLVTGTFGTVPGLLLLPYLTTAEAALYLKLSPRTLVPTSPELQAIIVEMK